ncbi:GFA family protein [Pseudoxanthobacter sp.]|uniref:GFA family protein n=1 Tax=Pseudoxanthobacter sp. TaxID=1925742 RepID=UPI002FE342C0
MQEARRIFHAGGCQCGAVRYHLLAEIIKPSVCHCRMCQKAFGGYFAPLGSVRRSDIAWVRGAPATFRSSTLVQRGFCAACGTPLTYDYLEVDEIAVSLGSLDDPAAVPPVIEYGLEGRMPWFSRLGHLPACVTEDDMPEGAMERLVSFQHPDHDTARWPAAPESAS